MVLLLWVEVAGNPMHLRVLALAFGKQTQLAGQIATIEAGKAGRQISIALALQTMACVASSLRSGISTGQCQQLSTPAVRIAYRRRATACQCNQRCDRQQPFLGNFHCNGNIWLRRLVPTQWQWGCMDAYRPEKWQLFSASPVALVAALALLTGCKPSPDGRAVSDDEAGERGLALIKANGCGACHAIPGLSWPRGKLAPSLENFDDRGLLAGTLPKTPANLAAFIRSAPQVAPGSTMPEMPLSATEAADIATYLLGTDSD